MCGVLGLDRAISAEALGRAVEKVEQVKLWF